MTNTPRLSSKPLSQERLKLIACISMLLDHIGATVVLQQCYTLIYSGADARWMIELYDALRIVGRLAFPIYCFLLAEGAHYTRSPGKYALRLGLAAVISEIPFDLAFYGGLTWEHQNVMVTLLIGLLALWAMQKIPHFLLKLPVLFLFAVLAELAQSDYGGDGVLVMGLFALTREVPRKRLLQFLGLWFLFSPGNRMALNWLDGFSLSVQEYGVLALIPISLYSGEKASRNKGLKYAFYLFYPVHMALLWIVMEVIYG